MRRRTEHFPSAEGRVLEGPSCPRAGGASWRGRECPGPEVCRCCPEDPLKAREFQSALGGSPAGRQFRSLSRELSYRAGQTSPVKDHVENILDLAGHVVSVPVTQLCRCSTHKCMRVTVPIKLYL